MDAAPTPDALFDGARGLYFAPIRHHSPACARALGALLDEVRPSAVLVEAPADFESLAPLIADSRCRPPVAIAGFAPKGFRPPGAEDGAPAEDAALACLYPLCAHAPEFVAMRWAAAEGAILRFIDLPALHRAWTTEPMGVREGPAPLMTERLFDASDYVRALARKRGCRDANELWDRLFESRAAAADWRGFFHAVAVYCAHTRAASDPARLASDDTLPRESAMRAHIAGARDETDGPIVVVTGGFHTPALIEDGEALAPAPKPVADAYLIRYGFAQLDQLSGYAAGLPSPAFYHMIWERGADGRLDRDAVVGLLGDFAETQRAARAEAGEVGAPALIAAAEHAFRLAALRGLAAPGREELQDAVLATMAKGEAAPVVGAFRRFLTGDALGDAPPGAGSPPLLEAVRAAARGHGFSLETGAPRDRELDIHRKPSHREASRFLHALSYLGASLGPRLRGPDFVHGHKTDLLFEVWSVAWSPMVESRLIELSAGAETLEAACLRRLRAEAASFAEEGRGRDAAAAVGLVLRAALVGLQSRVAEVARIAAAEIAEDADLASIGRALRRLDLLWRGRAVLDLSRDPSVGALIAEAYARALYLLPTLADLREERRAGALAALGDLREVVESGNPLIDAALWREALAALLDEELAPEIDGAVAALARLAGALCEDAFADRFDGALAGAYREPADQVGFLRGAMAAARALIWRTPRLIQSVDALLAKLDDDAFLALLPELRLAFSGLDPRETDRVAALAAELSGAAEDAAAGAVRYDVCEAEVAANLALSARLTRAAEAAGLAPIEAPDP